MVLWWATLFAIFPWLEWKYMGEILYIGGFFKISVNSAHSNTIWKGFFNFTFFNMFLWAGNIFKGHANISSFLCGPPLKRLNWQRTPINPVCFTLTSWKVAKTTAHQRLIFKVQKPVEIPILKKNSPFLSKYFNYISWPSPFKLKKEAGWPRRAERKCRKSECKAYKYLDGAWLSA